MPMEDAYFLADLSGKDLFRGNLKDEVSNQPTRADKARYFIAKLAEHRNTQSFLLLLDAMEDYSDALKDLARTIKAEFLSSKCRSTYEVHNTLMHIHTRTHACTRTCTQSSCVTHASGQCKLTNIF